MERRKILLGSGAVFATVLAGCSSADGDEENDGDDGGDGTTGDGGDGTTGDGGDGSDHDIPGFTEKELSLEEHHVEVKRVKRDGNAVEVVVSTTILSEEELEAELEELSTAIAEAIEDPDAFVNAIDVVYGTIIDADGNELATFHVEVAWAIAYLNGEMTAEEFANRVLETVD
ncbi:hypothetical protein [Salinilacihabitans rarus]|uniref:hypothetical protein n=1 Tax=Salinilacihabitans rarus TaxID=2961596 RepID=UPI0020C862A8|nr:hypothetical protein [Salinilacihabitans rarus]